MSMWQKLYCKSRDVYVFFVLSGQSTLHGTDATDPHNLEGLHHVASFTEYKLFNVKVHLDYVLVLAFDKVDQRHGYLLIFPISQNGSVVGDYRKIPGTCLTVVCSYRWLGTFFN